MRFRVACALWVSLSVWGFAANAQFVQYTPPGDFQGPAESRAQAFDEAMREARWRFGRILADPWIALTNVGYQDNLTELSASGEPVERISDLTASFGAGLNTYLPIGSDFVWGTFLLPEYVWWQDLADRRRLNGRYGTGLFGNLGRTGLEAIVSRSEQPQIFSIEVEEPFNQRADRAKLDLTIDLGKGLLVFARGAANRLRSLEDQAAFEALRRLDRDETVYAAGLGFLSTRGLRFGVGAEESETESLGANRSNRGSALVFDLQYDAPLFKLSADLARRSLEPEPGSAFVEFEGETGSMSLRLRAFGPVWVDLFGRRNLSLSVQEAVSHIEYDGLGVGVSAPLGSRTRLRVFLEQGDSTFVEREFGSVDRVDDRRSLGASMNLDLGRMSLVLHASRSEYESNFPENDRTTTRVTTSLALGGQGGTSPWVR